MLGVVRVVELHPLTGEIQFDLLAGSGCEFATVSTLSDFLRCPSR